MLLLLLFLFVLLSSLLLFVVVVVNSAVDPGGGYGDAVFCPPVSRPTDDPAKPAASHFMYGGALCHKLAVGERVL